MKFGVHYEDDLRFKDCENNDHKVFLFLRNMSNVFENENIHKCVCLECGKISDYEMSAGDMKRTVYTHLNYVSALNQFFEVRNQYLELSKQESDIEKIIATINLQYQTNKENENDKTKIISLSKK